jgi:CheY-like chemotaxis protein/anti-sigma regulatory factor (Ser/Thr protein kinase)
MPSAAAKGLRVETRLDARAGTVLADASRLQQVVSNLLTNAVKFTPDGGTVGVELRRSDAGIAVTVRDTGIGIAPEFLPSVFDRFRQADSSSTRRHGGLGIGLTLVKQLIDLHGGSVRVESDGVGRGACFTVELPAAGLGVPEPAPPEDRLPESLFDGLLDGVRVLYVDDDRDARILGQRILADREAEVLLAASADEALRLLRTGRPDVLVSDIGLPDVDGYELIRRVRQLSAEDGGRTPAAALTAFARSEDRSRALLAGYQAHVSKPIVPEELVAVVAGLSGRRRAPVQGAKREASGTEKFPARRSLT